VQTVDVGPAYSNDGSSSSNYPFSLSVEPDGEAYAVGPFVATSPTQNGTSTYEDQAEFFSNASGAWTESLPALDSSSSMALTGTLGGLQATTLNASGDLLLGWQGVWI